MKGEGRVANGSAGGRLTAWIRFLIGLGVLGSCVAFFASGYSPPGFLGEVLRHNQRHEIDASALFYSEVENMQELEAALAESMESGLSHGDTLSATVQCRHEDF